MAGQHADQLRAPASGYVYDFHLEDGRTLGDLPLNPITETMIGAVLDRARTSGAGGKKGKSLATQDQTGSPLRRFFREMIRKQGLPGRGRGLVPYAGWSGSSHATRRSPNS